MNNLFIPSSPNWYESRILACSVDNTVVYGTRNDVVMIKPTEEDKEADVKMLPPAHYGRILSVDVNQNWSPGNKLIVSAGDDKQIHLWDAETCTLKSSNSIHTTQTEKLIGSVFMGTDKVVSVSENGFVSLWRFNSGETTTFKNLFAFKTHITTLSACPHVTWMVAFGLQCGLVVITDLRKTGRVVYKLRGHDKSVVSLSWCPTPFNIFPKKVPLFQRLWRKVEGEGANSIENGPKLEAIPKINEPLEESKLSKEKIEEIPTNGTECIQKDGTNEFTSPQSAPKDMVEFSSSAVKEPVVATNGTECIQKDDTSEFISPQDIVESSSTVKEPVVDSDINTSQVIDQTCGEKFDNILEAPAEVTNQFQETPHNEELDDKTKLCETDSFTENNDVTPPRKEYLLASSARGGSIFIWRAGTDGYKEMELSIGGNKHKRWRSADKGWISLCWIAPDVLLSSSPSAELLQWDLLQVTKKGSPAQRKLIHHDHNNNLFVIAAPIALVHEWSNNVERPELFAWTTGQERYLLNTSLQADRTLLISYPTIGGNVYTIRSSPIDPCRLAIGIGDNTAKVWDLSRPHKQSITMANLWQKIQSKVLALAWHPQKEMILAYATAEGRIGTVNTASKNTTLLCQYFRNSVYDIQWGPVEGNQENIGLYAVGEGKLVVYNTAKESEEPQLVESPTKEHIQCLAWKADYSLLACGTKTGSIIVYDMSLNHITTIYSEYKSTYCIVWHPLATLEDEGTSPLASWLAISSGCTSVVVFDISADKANNEQKLEVAVLNRHTKPVRCVSWSPFVGGRIVSGGDDGVIFVWDVQTKAVLSTFLEHNSEPVLTVLWSPLDQDFVISAGKDNSIRVWNISEHKPKANEEITTAQKPYLLFRCEKRKISKEANQDVEDDTPKIQRHAMLSLTSKAQNTPEGGLNDCVRLFSMFNQGKNTEVDATNILVNEFDVLKMFGDKNNMMELLNAEQKNHEEKKKTQWNQYICLWKGDVADMVKKSITQGNVSPWLISLAPMISPELWKEACEVYAKKLMEDAKSNPIEAASYLLICHKVEEAIECLCSATLFREALALAKCRLSQNDPIVNEILKKWATFGIVNGAYEISAQCFIALGQYEEAAKALFRRTNIDALKFALALAEKSGNKDLIDACTLRYNNFKNAGEGDEVQNGGSIEIEETKDISCEGDLLTGDNLLGEAQQVCPAD